MPKEIKKIRLTNIDLTVNTTTLLVVTIDVFKFYKDTRNGWLQINLVAGGGDSEEFVDEVHGKEAATVNTIEDLKRFALNWIFNNVEIVSAKEMQNIKVKLNFDDVGGMHFDK